MSAREILARKFAKLRHDPAHHMGLGDIRLTMGQQEDLIEALAALSEPVGLPWVNVAERFEREAATHEHYGNEVDAAVARSLRSCAAHVRSAAIPLPGAQGEADDQPQRRPGESLLDYCARTSREVDTWPEWKRDALGKMPTPPEAGLREAVEDVLDGTPLDAHGNRDDDGMNTHCAMQWDGGDAPIRYWRDRLTAALRAEGGE